MENIEWEKKQFESFFLERAKKPSKRGRLDLSPFIGEDDVFHFEWSGNSVELINDSTEQMGYYVLTLSDRWQGWLARAELENSEEWQTKMAVEMQDHARKSLEEFRKAAKKVRTDHKCTHISEKEWERRKRDFVASKAGLQGVPPCVVCDLPKQSVEVSGSKVKEGSVYQPLEQVQVCRNCLAPRSKHRGLKHKCPKR